MFLSPLASLLFAGMSPEHFDYNGKFVVALTTVKYNKTIIKKILHDCWTKRIVNVIVLQPSSNQCKVLLYTYFPYTSTHCEQVKPVEYNFLETDLFAIDKSHFPFKLSNLYQCSLRISSYNLPPHMILTASDSDSSIIHTDGIDGITLRTLSQKLNFHPIVINSSLNLFLVDLKANDSFSESLEIPRSLDMVIIVV